MLRTFWQCKTSFNTIMNIFPFQFLCYPLCADSAASNAREESNKMEAQQAGEEKRSEAGSIRSSSSSETRKLNFYCFHTNKIK